jgi:hypothetical protein
MSTETTNQATDQTTANPTADTKNSTAQNIAAGVLKVAGLALLVYRAYSAAKQPRLAKPAEPQVTRGSDGQSMAKVDPNILLNMGLQHMRNMTRPRMW